VATFVEVEETGHLREVKRACRSCSRSLPGDPADAALDWNPPILSPSGIGHAGQDDGRQGSERTACGKDATGDGWWHRL
jgi:hypothetical protein